MDVVPVFLVKHHPVYHPPSPPLRSVMGFLSPLRGPGAAQPLSPSPGTTAVLCGASPHPQQGKNFPPTHRQTLSTASTPRQHEVFPLSPFILNLIFFFPLLLNPSPGPRAGSGPMRGSERAAGPESGGFPDGAGAGGDPELPFRPLRIPGAGGLSRRPLGAPLATPLWGDSPQRRWGSHLSPRPQHTERAPPPD